jgi:methylenetetrahydrofolate--tRNA-(uracil-5-)-methyltransferase
LGSIHRNTFVNGPEVLRPTLQLKKFPWIFLAGQITGVEGYVESSAMGILAGLNATRLVKGQALLVPPPTTAIGSLAAYVTRRADRPFQPMNVNFGLFPPLPGNPPRRQRGSLYAQRALGDLKRWMATEGLTAFEDKSGKESPPQADP